MPHRVAALVKELRDLKKQLGRRAAPAELSADKLLAEASQTSATCAIVVAEAPGADANAMRQLIDQLRKTASPMAVLLGSREEAKSRSWPASAAICKQRGLDAGEWIRGAAEVVGGRGGGKPDMAQAGGKHPEKLPERASAAARKHRHAPQSVVENKRSLLPAECHCWLVQQCRSCTQHNPHQAVEFHGLDDEILRSKRTLVGTQN